MDSPENLMLYRVFAVVAPVVVVSSQSPPLLVSNPDLQNMLVAFTDLFKVAVVFLGHGSRASRTRPSLAQQDKAGQGHAMQGLASQGRTRQMTMQNKARTSQAGQYRWVHGAAVSS